MGVSNGWFLLTPLNKDVVMVLLSARQPDLVLHYAAVATVGSVIGCAVLFVMGRRARKHLPGGRWQKFQAAIERQVERHGHWAVAVAAILPPPAPFTSVVAVAGAFGHSPISLLATIGAARFVRFAVEGALAAQYGAELLSLFERSAVRYGVLAFTLVPIALAAIPVARWLKRQASSD